MVEQSSDQAVTLRRRSEAIVGAVVVVVGLIGTVYLLLTAGPDTSLSDRLQLVAAMLPLLWLAWLAGPHPRIYIYDDNLVVVNWFTRTTAPLSCVESIDAADGVVIKLTTGERIKPASGSPAIADRWRKKDLQKHIKDALDTARAAAPPRSSTGEKSKRRLDVTPLFPVAFGSCLALIAWLASR